MSEKLSVIIPALNEPYLQNTIDDVLKKASGEVEVVVFLDGYWPDPPVHDHKNVVLIHSTQPVGMRSAINGAARVATGKYLMKCDAHCAFDEGFDEKLKADCEYDWTVVPRRYRLNTKTWDKNDGKIFDFQYITNPDDRRYAFKGADWPEYGERVKGRDICDLMTSQGSCWFMHRDRFFELGALDDVNYGGMGREAQETCLKAWLSGGRYVLNRKTWYAHWKKNGGVNHSYRNTFPKAVGNRGKSRDFAIDLWCNDKWPLQKRTLKSLIDQFSPVPTWQNLESLDSQRYIQEKYKRQGVSEYPAVIKGMKRENLVELFGELGFKVGAEVGVLTARFSKVFFRAIPDVKMYLVDPYLKYEGIDSRSRNNDAFAECRRRAHKRMRGKNANFIEKMSVEAAKDIEDGSLDFVYIDGNHRYEYVLEDIAAWLPKIRKGGIISGHDYFNSGRNRKVGVKKAVIEYTAKNKIVPWYITDTFPHERHGRYASFFWVKD